MKIIQPFEESGNRLTARIEVLGTEYGLVADIRKTWLTISDSERKESAILSSDNTPYHSTGAFIMDAWPVQSRIELAKLLTV